MATAPPTASSLRSWEEAFSHPLPVVRKLESQMRTNILENQNKLRSLVGASYRDLLGTAERIIDMDSQMQLVESNLAQTGRRCDYRVVQKGRANLEGLNKVGKGGEERRLEAMARVQILRGALDAVGRCVRKGGDALVGAKVLVLARLMHKSVSGCDDTPSLVLDLGTRLASLRKKLLAYIESSLVKTTSDRGLLLNTLCAYVMITSSAPKDALRHFLQVRYESLETMAESPTEESVLEMLDVYSKTLLSARDLFPRRASEALSQLSRTPLLQDAQVQSTQELNLDVYQRWIPEDVRTFTPWVRHDQLGVSDANEGLKSWARQAQTCLVSGIESCLQTLAKVDGVLALRHKVLSKYFAVSSKLPSDHLTESIDSLRDAFVTRLTTLVVKVADISEFALASLDTSATSTTTNPQGSPWDMASQRLDLSAGALPFRAAVVNQRHGRDTAVQKEHNALDRWLAQLNEHWDFVAKMRSTRWDDDVEYDLDDLEYEGAQSLQVVLGRKDPTELEAKLREATAEAMGAAYAKVQDSSRDAPFRIRLLRELNHRRQALGDRLGVLKLDLSETIMALHATIAEQACSEPLRAFRTSLEKRKGDTSALWDGTPPLPIQPTPTTYRFVSSLQRSMASMGEDLWSPHAVKAVKTYVLREISDGLSSSPGEPTTTNSRVNDAEDDSGVREPDGDGAEGNSQAAPSTDKASLQRLFDALYLARAFSTPQGSPEDTLQPTVEKLSQGVDLEEAARQRLAKSALEYWRRTHLLFGLLAV